MAGTATARAATIERRPKTTPSRTDAYRAGHPNDEGGDEEDMELLYQERMVLRRFHEKKRRAAYTRMKRHTHVLLLLRIDSINICDDCDCGGEDGVLTSSSSSSSRPMSAMDDCLGFSL